MNRTLFLLYIIILLISAGCNINNGLPDLRESFSYKDTKPFGSSIAFKLVKKSYPANSIILKKNSFFESTAWTSDTGSVYINISRKYFANAEDVNALIDFVYKGNTAFISAGEFDTILLEKLDYAQKNFDSEKSFLNGFFTDTHASLVPAVRSINDSIYGYYYFPFVNYFSKISEKYSRIVGYNTLSEPNFTVFFWGKGRLYLHCEPRAFSNYFLLQTNNYQYLLQPLQLLPENPEHIFWDDYYNKLNYRGGSKSISLFGALFKNPPLKWAFLLLLAVFLIYILVNARRRQRLIPVIKPVENSSVAFAEAVAGLYLKDKNNKSIAEKMIAYFNESIRTRYYLSSTTFDDQFVQSLSKKGAVPIDDVKQLYDTIAILTYQPIITDSELMDLNNKIQQFNKHKN